MIEQFGFTSLREVIAALFLLSGLVFSSARLSVCCACRTSIPESMPPVTVKLLAVRFPLSV